MPKYRCHKEVHALKILSIDILDNGDAIIMPEEDGYASFQVPVEYVEKHKPEVGGYYVVYEGGYKSWSPAEPFESGYTRIE